VLSWFALGLVVLYFVVGQKVTLDAYRHLRNPRHRYSHPPLLNPEEFTAEGERWRRRAVRYWYGGGAVVGLIFLAALLSQRS
jgi:hypothetical protein